MYILLCAALTLLSIPQEDKYRAFFVWHFNRSDSVLQSKLYQQELIDTCKKYRYNLIFLGVEPFLSPKGYSIENELAIRELVHSLYLQGIEVHALMGQGSTYGDPYARKSHGYGSEQQWVIDNIIKPVQQYNLRAPDDSKFSGFLLDNEYYNNGKGTYSIDEAVGTFELLQTARQMLPGLKIGHTPNWTLANERYAYRINYKGRNNIEGFHILDQCDYVVVQAYRNNTDTQMAMFKPWLDNAVISGHQIGLMMASDVDKLGDVRSDFTYNTLNAGDKLKFETNLLKVSKTYQNNKVWWGHAVHSFHAYRAMQ